MTKNKREIIKLLSDYSRALEILWKYDHDKLVIPKGKKADFSLDYNRALSVIEELKLGIDKKLGAGDLFGQEISKKFESIIKNLYQTFGKEELYKTIEEKAAHLLYLIIKDHPFADGNKRISAFLFIYFLYKNKHLYGKGDERKISENTLVALVLLIAVSHSEEKDAMIKIICNLLR